MPELLAHVGDGRVLLQQQRRERVAHVVRAVPQLGLSQIARNAFRTFESSSRDLDSETPHLVVLDLFLPTISGLVVQQDIAPRAELRHVPVLVVTAATPDQTLALDVDCVLYKPLMPDQLVDAVRECLIAPRARS